MDVRDFVTLTLLATSGEIQGRTKLQKMVYFLGLMTGTSDGLGYYPHFYGPHSDDVAEAVMQLRTVGAIDQNVTNWDYDRPGFEVKRHDYRLNETGRRYAQGVAQRNYDLWHKLRDAAEVFKQAGDRDYMALSIAAKTYLMLGQQKTRTSIRNLA